MPGGMLLYGYNNDSTEKISINFKNAQDSIVLENGDWDFFIIGWSGTNHMEGIVECGGTSSMLSGSDATIEFNISNAKCLAPDATGLKFISANQFLNFAINACNINPGTPTTGTTCTGNVGSTNSFKLSLRTSYIDEFGVKIDDALTSECYDLTSGNSTPPLILPFGGSSHSNFVTEIEAFENTGCTGATESFKLPNGLADTSFTSTDPSGDLKIISDASDIVLFVETPAIINSNAFASLWRTTGASESITLPLRAGYTYNFTVNWGDGSPIDTLTSDSDPDRIHIYAVAGDYTVTIVGTVEAWYFNNVGDKLKLIAVNNFGDMGWICLLYTSPSPRD